MFQSFIFLVNFQDWNKRARTQVLSTTCLTCNKQFSSDAKLRLHQCGGYKCELDQCEKILGSREALKRHINIHNKAHSCAICKKCYGSISELTRHSKIHNGQQFNCDTCNSTFKHKQNLKIHKKSCE